MIRYAAVPAIALLVPCVLVACDGSDSGRITDVVDAPSGGAEDLAFPEDPAWFREALPTDRLRVLYSGDVRGEIEPCGCPNPERRRGGLSRFARWVAAEREHSGRALTLDAGNLFFAEPELADDERAHALAKAELTARSYSHAGLDAMTVGPYDLSLGYEVLADLVREHDLPVTAANLYTPKGRRPWPAYRLIRVGERLVGIVGAAAAGIDSGLVEGNPLADIGGAVEDARAGGADLVIVLSSRGGTAGLSPALVDAGADLIIESGTAVARALPEIRSETLVVSTDRENKLLGRLSMALTPGARGLLSPRRTEHDRLLVAGLESRGAALRAQSIPVEDEVQTLRRDMSLRALDDDLREAGARLARADRSDPPFHLVHHALIPLDRTVPDEPTVASAVFELKTERAAAFEAELFRNGEAQPRPPGPFVGAEACKPCHAAEFEQWSGTPHATAWDTLKEADRHWDPQCFGCHVTGHGRPGGPRNPEEAGELVNVQCEACHGAGRAHASNPGRANIVGGNSVDEICMPCHSDERTMGRFDPETYLPRARHAAPGTSRN